MLAAVANLSMLAGYEIAYIIANIVGLSCQLSPILSLDKVSATTLSLPGRC